MAFAQTVPRLSRVCQGQGAGLWLNMDEWAVKLERVRNPVTAHIYIPIQRRVTLAAIVVFLYSYRCIGGRAPFG